VTTEESKPTLPARKPHRRWWSLSVRGLMLLVLIVGGVIGWEVNRVNRIRRAVAVLVRNSDDPPDFRPPSETISFTIGDAPSRTEVTFATVQSPWIPDWLRATLGDEHFPRVVKLVLARSPSATDWDAIAALGSVRTLNLTYVPLKDADLALLPVCADLRELSLIGTEITDGAMASVGTLRNLRTLDLRMTKVTPGGLAPLANLTQLEKLELSSGAGTDVGVGHIRGLTKLRTLGATGFGSELSDVGLGHLKEMTQLESLEFAARHVSDKGIAILAQLPRLRVLKIHAAFPHVSEAIALTARGVEQLGQFSSLERLDLDPETAIDDTWLRAIGRLVGLRQFQIAGAGITDAGLAYLQGLPNLENSGSSARMSPMPGWSTSARWLAWSSLASSPGSATPGSPRSDPRSPRSSVFITLNGPTTRTRTATFPPCSRLPLLQYLSSSPVRLNPSVPHLESNDASRGKPRMANRRPQTELEEPFAICDLPFAMNLIPEFLKRRLKARRWGRRRVRG